MSTPDDNTEWHYQMAIPGDYPADNPRWQRQMATQMKTPEENLDDNRITIQTPILVKPKWPHQKKKSDDKARWQNQIKSPDDKSQDNPDDNAIWQRQLTTQDDNPEDCTRLQHHMTTPDKETRCQPRWQSRWQRRCNPDDSLDDKPNDNIVQKMSSSSLSLELLPVLSSGIFIRFVIFVVIWCGLTDVVIWWSDLVLWSTVLLSSSFVIWCCRLLLSSGVAIWCCHLLFLYCLQSGLWSWFSSVIFCYHLELSSGWLSSCFVNWQCYLGCHMGYCLYIRACYFISVKIHKILKM
jgi:hypothetical protein